MQLSLARRRPRQPAPSRCRSWIRKTRPGCDNARIARSGTHQARTLPTIQTGPRSCLLVPRIIVHRTEPIKLVDLDVVGAGALIREGGRSRHLLRSLLGLQALLIRIELGLFPIIDAVLLRGWINVIQLPFI